MHPVHVRMSFVVSSVRGIVELGGEAWFYDIQLINDFLLSVLSQDEEIRLELLNIIPSSLCSHLAESQFMANPIMVFMSKPPASRAEILPSWR